MQTLLRIVMFIMALALAACATAAKNPVSTVPTVVDNRAPAVPTAQAPADQVVPMIVQIKEFQGKACMMYLGKGIELTFDPEPIEGYPFLDVKSRGTETEAKALVMFWLWADELCRKATYRDLGETTQACQEKFSGKKEVADLMQMYTRPCVPTTATQASNTWMSGGAEGIKVLSVQNVRRKVGKRGEAEVVLVTYEAPAPLSAEADVVKK